ncbi:hypothetical protein HRED_01214 [Candidatus Haloredivivus sp. G17]|jgi:hypothetical protein|nr:hypothetical protein HRED_01214 [Candidatus Haloredivivus sp. G17]
MTIDKLESNRSTYQVLRDQADRIEENPSSENISDYDAVVKIDGEAYGVDFENGQAKAEANLRSEGAEVYGARESRGSLSAGILSEDLEREMTVEEAARPLNAE